MMRARNIWLMKIVTVELVYFLPHPCFYYPSAYSAHLGHWRSFLIYVVSCTEFIRVLYIILTRLIEFVLFGAKSYSSWRQQSMTPLTTPGTTSSLKTIVTTKEMGMRYIIFVLCHVARLQFICSLHLFSLCISYQVNDGDALDDIVWHCVSVRICSKMFWDVAEKIIYLFPKLKLIVSFKKESKIICAQLHGTRGSSIYLFCQLTVIGNIIKELLPTIA